MSKMIEIPHDLYIALCDIESFVRDCCMTGDVMDNNPIAPMSDSDQRTVGDVLKEISNLRGGE